MSQRYDPWEGFTQAEISADAQRVIAMARAEREAATAAGHTPNTWPKNRRPNPFELAARMDAIAERIAACGMPTHEELENQRRALEQAAERAAQSEQEALERKMRDANIPERIREDLGWKLDRNSSLTRAQQFLRSPDWFLALGGSKGVGKTLAACWALVKAPTMGCFTKCYDVCQQSSWDAQRSAFERTPFLVIDDVGTEYGDRTGFSLANFWQVLDRRYDGNRKTIITLNVTPQVFKQRYVSAANGGDRLLDRLRKGASLFVASETESYRGAENHPAPKFVKPEGYVEEVDDE